MAMDNPGVVQCAVARSGVGDVGKQQWRVTHHVSLSRVPQTPPQSVPTSYSDYVRHGDKDYSILPPARPP
jgi:hypothetical protein